MPCHTLGADQGTEGWRPPRLVPRLPGGTADDRAAAVLQDARLGALRRLTAGDPRVRIALLDGSVDTGHPCLAGAAIRELWAEGSRDPDPVARPHATHLASMLVGRGDSVVGLAPCCTLLSVPVVDAAFREGRLTPDTAAARIARAIVRAVAHGADVIQLSMAFAPEIVCPFRPVMRAIWYAAQRGVFTVIAAGDGPTLGASPVLGAPGVVPVAAAGTGRRVATWSPLGGVVATRGLLAPGVGIPGASSPTGYATRSGSSFAAGVVTGGFALLRSLPGVESPAAVWEALLALGRRHLVPRSMAPPMLDGDLALAFLRDPGARAREDRWSRARGDDA